MDSFKNKRILINGKTVYATDVSLSTISEIAPNFINTDKTNNFVSNSFVKNSLSMNYFVEGADPLLPYIFDYQDFITGDFCGINFKSGLLQSYSLNIRPNAPIQLSATILFWGGTGKLEQNNSWLNNENTRPVSFTGNVMDNNLAYPLNGSGIYFTHNQGVNLPNLNIQELSYSFTSTPSPVFHAGYVEPKEFNFGPRASETNVLVDSYTGLMNVSGEPTYFDVSFRNISGDMVMSLPIDGYIYQRNFAANPTSLFRNRFSILQSNIIKPFTFSSLSASSAYAGETVTINGSNLKQIQSVKVGSVLLQSFTQRDNQISFTIPKNAKSSKIYLQNDSQTIETSVFTVLDSGITITGFSPISGSAYSDNPWVDISGLNLFNIDRLYFGSGRCNNYYNVSDTLIRANVPSGATYDFIYAESTERNKTAYSNFKFVPIPNALGYIANKRSMSQPITFTGDHLSGVTGVSFNNLATVQTYRQSFDDGIRSISANLPSGNTRGYVRFYMPSGITKLSSFTFEPEIFITGLNIISGQTGSLLQITGNPLIPELLDYAGTADYYYVSIGDSEKSLFGKTSHLLLTGIIPTGATSGPLKVHANNGSQYTWSGIFSVTPPKQQILGVYPYYISWPEETRVSGVNFFNIVSVEYTDGYNAPYTGFVQNYKVALDGRSISIPSTGIADYSSGSAITHEYGLRIVSSQGESLYPNAFEISDYKIPGNAGWPASYTLTALVSGLDVDQTDSFVFENFSSYDNVIRIPALSGFNWYNANTGFAYGVGREITVAPGATKTINLYTSGSGNIFARDLTGLFRSSDGFTQTYLIELRPS